MREKSKTKERKNFLTLYSSYHKRASLTPQKSESSTLANREFFLTLVPFLGVSLLLSLVSKANGAASLKVMRSRGGRAWGQHHCFWKVTFLTAAEAAFSHILVPLVFIGRFHPLPEFVPTSAWALTWACRDLSDTFLSLLPLSKSQPTSRRGERLKMPAA